MRRPPLQPRTAMASSTCFTVETLKFYFNMRGQMGCKKKANHPSTCLEPSGVGRSWISVLPLAPQPG